MPHDEREHFDKLRAAHVTLRLVRGYDSLRQRATYDVLRIATEAVSKRPDFRIVHLSIELDHVHLVVEANNHVALGNGVRAFQISAAQRLNRAIGRARGERVRGKVFAERYDVRFIGSPTQARNTINYVLNNWRRHGQDETGIEVRYWDIDYMSSAISFDGWAELEQPNFVFRYRVPVEERLCVAMPRSWLLSKGWRKVGSISMYALPGQIKPTKETRMSRGMTRTGRTGIVA